MIVIDIDNTVTNQISRLAKNYDTDLDVMIARSTSEMALMNDELFDDAKAVITELAQKHKIVWLSARKLTLYEITLKWIKQNNLPCDELILVDKLEDKLPVLIKLKPILFIDDLQYDLYSLQPKPATKFREKLNSACIPYYVFNKSWTDVKKYLIDNNIM